MATKEQDRVKELEQYLNDQLAFARLRREFPMPVQFGVGIGENIYSPVLRDYGIMMITKEEDRRAFEARNAYLRQ